MAITINGTTGIAGVDGSASTPAVQGADTNTGIFFPAADTIAFGEGGAEVARFNSSGQLGIGTTAPTIALDVRTTDAAAGRFSRSGTSGQITSIVFEDGSGTLGSANTTRIASSTGYLAFSTGGTSGDTTGGTERARIDSSGNFLVGKTSATGTTQGIFLQADGVYGFTKNETGTGPLGYFINANGTVTSGYRFASFRVTSSFTEVGTITTNGTSTTAYNTSSDYRLKENIAPMTGALATITQLNPVTYTWKADGSAGQGFIAHELQAVVPDCVTGEKDAVETYTDEEGVEQTRPVYQGVDTSFLVATLTAAIQELKAELDTTKARLAALEAK